MNPSRRLVQSLDGVERNARRIHGRFHPRSAHGGPGYEGYLGAVSLDDGRLAGFCQVGKRANGAPDVSLSVAVLMSLMRHFFATWIRNWIRCVTRTMRMRLRVWRAGIVEFPTSKEMGHPCIVETDDGAAALFPVHGHASREPWHPAGLIDGRPRASVSHATRSPHTGLGIFTRLFPAACAAGYPRSPLRG